MDDAGNHRNPTREDWQAFLAEWSREAKSREVHFQFEAQAFDAMTESREKLDTWLTALAGAVLAYAVQSYDGGVLRSFRWLAPISWGFLLASVYHGIRSQREIATMHFGYFAKIAGERATQKRLHRITQLRVAESWDIAVRAEITRDINEQAEYDQLLAHMETLEEDDYLLGRQREDDGEKLLQAAMRIAQRHSLRRSVFLVAGLAVMAILRLLNLNP